MSLCTLSGARRSSDWLGWWRTRWRTHPAGRHGPTRAASGAPASARGRSMRRHHADIDIEKTRVAAAAGLSHSHTEERCCMEEKSAGGNFQAIA